VSVHPLSTSLEQAIDKRLAIQLIDEALAVEEAFLLKRWKYTELDGGRFTEVAARIVYAADSGNVSMNKSVDDCVKYIDNNQLPHHFPEPKSAIHIAKVIRAVYKLRSQRGAVHVSATYTANEIDSRLIVESVRWILAEILRIFVNSDRETVADSIRNLARFPQPLIRFYEDLPLLQSISFTTEEEVLTHLLYADNGLKIGELIALIPKDQSGIRRAIQKLGSARYRQVVLRSERWFITDLGIERIENRISLEASQGC
jgi:hypothetical protein